MINYNELKEEQQIEREIREFKKVEKECEQRKQFAETLQNPILKKMVLDTINESPFLFEIADSQANFNLRYYENWREGDEK